jgi:hypothetical protein
MNHWTKCSALGGVVLIASTLGCSGDSTEIIDTYEDASIQDGDAQTQDSFRPDVHTSDTTQDQKTPDGPLPDGGSDARDARPDTNVVPDARPDATDAHPVDSSEASTPDAQPDAWPDADASADSDAANDADEAGDSSPDTEAAGGDSGDLDASDGSEQADGTDGAEAAADAGPTLCSILQDGLVAAWSLDSTLQSRLSGGNPLAIGTGSSALGFGAGVGGGEGLLLDGNSFAETPDTAGLQITDALTLSAWVAASTFEGRIIDKITAGQGDGYLLDGYGGHLRAIIGSRLFLGTAAAPTGNTPAHVAAVFTGGSSPQIRLFVN